jgi:hypothetical protein
VKPLPIELGVKEVIAELLTGIKIRFQLRDPLERHHSQQRIDKLRSRNLIRYLQKIYV